MYGEKGRTAAACKAVNSARALPTQHPLLELLPVIVKHVDEEGQWADGASS